MIENTSERKNLVEPIDPSGIFSSSVGYLGLFMLSAFTSMVAILSAFAGNSLVIPFGILALIFTPLTIASHRANTKYYKAYLSSLETTNSNVTAYLKEKYGVALLDSVITRYGKVNGDIIRATNAEGERIQVTIELTDNNTDVLAFSSGAEMPRIKQYFTANI